MSSGHTAAISALHRIAGMPAVSARNADAMRNVAILALAEIESLGKPVADAEAPLPIFLQHQAE